VLKNESKICSRRVADPRVKKKTPIVENEAGLKRIRKRRQCQCDERQGCQDVAGGAA
jgi:hypothetical protein